MPSWWIVQAWLGAGQIRLVLKMMLKGFAPVGIRLSLPGLLVQPLQTGAVAYQVTEFFLREGVRAMLKASFAECEDHFLLFAPSMRMSHGLMYLVQHRIQDSLYGRRRSFSVRLQLRIGPGIDIIQQR